MIQKSPEKIVPIVVPKIVIHAGAEKEVSFKLIFYILSEVLEPVCCKKQQKKLLASYSHLDSYTKFGIIQVLQRSPVPQTSN